jgi:cell division septation protein DedD
MRMMLASATLIATMLASAAWAGVDLARGEDTAQDIVSIGVDADPTGNTATSLGTIDSCRSVSTGDTFQVDVFVADVTDLLAWETYFTYDMSVVNIASRDVMLFQAANAGSQVFDVSEGLPDIDSWYRIAAADLAQPPAPDSGSGVLARLTLEAIGPGISPASLSPIDVNNDGTIDLGPFLRDTEGEPISDLDGDGFFDGPISNAEIAVDTLCSAGTPVATPTVPSASPSPTAPASPAVETPSASPTPRTPAAATSTPTPASSAPTEDEGSAWTGGPAIIGYVLGGLAVLLLGGIGLISIRGGRSR